MRLTVLPWFVWAFIVVVVWSIPVSLRAEAALHTHERDGLVIKLLPGVCTDPVASMMLAMAPEQIRDGAWKALDSTWPHRDGTKGNYGGCWKEVSAELAYAITNGKENEPSFLMVFSDRQGMLITKKNFVRKKGQVSI